jgi:hypothetical protein
VKDGEQKNKKVVAFSRRLEHLIKEKILEAYEKGRNASSKWMDGIETNMMAT